MADVTANAESPQRARGPLFYIGAVALVLAMFVETIAVIGRHIGTPFLGAIEIIQTSILLIGTSSMVSATVNDAHAQVTFMKDRLPAGLSFGLQIFSCVLSAAFFVALAAGALWLAADYWNAHEESEVLHIPFRPLRLLSFASAASIAVIFLTHLLRKPRKEPA